MNTITRVTVDGRTFLVVRDMTGALIRIRERKAKEPPQLGVYEATYWSAAHHEMPKNPASIVCRVLKASEQK